MRREKDTSCVDTEPHPIAQTISEKYDTTYDRVMEWFCSGVPLDDIMLGLETHDLAQIPVEELLVRASEVGWEQLWIEVGLVESPPAGTGG